jgi:stringent starvation protein B
MSSSRPYLIRALHQWIVDNGLTPHLVVDAQMEGVEVPRQFVQDGRIILNISPTAVANLELNNDYVAFNARFSGRPMDVFLPPRAVLAVYARENGRGMAFGEEEGEEEGPPPDDGPGPEGGRPSLRVVK